MTNIKNKNKRNISQIIYFHWSKKKSYSKNYSKLKKIDVDNFYSTNKY